MPEPPSTNDSRQTFDPAGEPTRELPAASGKSPFTGGAMPEPYHDLTDETLGEFRILRRIGRGGMSEVYLAQQTSLSRNVALKILRPDLVSDETHVKRFHTEALAVAGLNHPNIIQVYSVGSDQGFEFIAQEYVQGYNLRQFLVRKGPPELPMALHIMKQVASALVAAAHAGVVHRDIKPENILITRKGTVKVADFGLAQLTLQGERVNLTQVGMTIGTPLYMSPEQVNGSNVGHQSDIYSFGVTAYHMLAGSPPFRGATAMSVAVQHIKNDPTPLEQLRPDLPKFLCRIVHKMMAKKLEERYRTADAVLTDLKRAAKDAGEEGGPLLENAMPTEEIDPKPAPVLEKGKSVKTFLDLPWKNYLKPLLASMLFLFGVSFLSGWAALPPNPLDNPQPPLEQEIEIKDSVAAQYFHAFKLGGTEAAWQKVIDVSEDSTDPGSAFFRDAARKQLALRYLAQGDFSSAEEIFQNFITSSDPGPENRAFGYAGMVLLFHEKGEFESSQAEFLKHLDRDSSEALYDSLDERTQRMVLFAVEQNLSRLDRKQGPERLQRYWDELQEPNGEEGSQTR